ncbi:hypothetical protein NF865_07895 [Thermococcus aggregans]|uniref:Uncharacterized protein n=1 Tax=Thermococcus aggregans TaxID=110163 RepID=A0A9E7MWN7_THEAG|nr:hypothetical protein [Thermococcus aggregans]USS40243.1 hypothetical protein NF865_07895 [Thermococcus aggregans]
MKPGRKLILEAVLIPLAILLAFWGLYYFRPPSPSKKMTIAFSGVITAGVSFFVALAVALFILKRRLEKEHNSKFGFGELLQIIDETDVRVIQDSAKDIVFIILMWGSLSTALVDMGFERGVIYVINFAVMCVMICLPVFLAIGVLFIDFPIFLYARFVGKDGSPGSKEIFLGSFLSLVFLVVVGLVASYSDVHIEAIRPILNFYREEPTVYRYVLLLSGSEALYSLQGMLIYSKKRKLGILLILLTVPLIAYTLFKTLMWTHSH